MDHLNIDIDGSLDVFAFQSLLKVLDDIEHHLNRWLSHLTAQIITLTSEIKEIAMKKGRIPIQTVRVVAKDKFKVKKREIRGN